MRKDKAKNKTKTIAIECYGGPYDGHIFNMPADLSAQLGYVVVRRTGWVRAEYALVWQLSDHDKVGTCIQRRAIYRLQCKESL